MRMMRLKEHLTKVLDYLEEDEREDFLTRNAAEVAGHIYPVIAAARAALMGAFIDDEVKLLAAAVCDYLETQERRHFKEGQPTSRAFHVMRHIHHVRRCLEREGSA